MTNLSEIPIYANLVIPVRNTNSVNMVFLEEPKEACSLQDIRGMPPR